MKALSTFSARIAAAALTLVAAVGVSASAHAASDGPYELDILINGRPAHEYYSRQTTYVEARRNLEYSIRLSNHTGERVAVALSVDGLNTIDAKHTSAAAARKWVLGPYESSLITGWQTSSMTSRSFYFTGESSSYGAWMGDTRNLGNISAAFFREQRPMVRLTPPPSHYEYDVGGDYDYNRRYGAELEGRAGASRDAGTGASEQASKSPSRSSESLASGSAPAAKARGEASRQVPTDEDLAATGIGRETRHDVYTVAFRQESSPTAVITVRYEFRDRLIELGILPRPYRPSPVVRREHSQGFSDYGYAPDPESYR